jgi:hypothetical protein
MQIRNFEKSLKQISEEKIKDVFVSCDGGFSKHLGFVAIVRFKREVSYDKEVNLEIRLQPYQFKCKKQVKKLVNKIAIELSKGIYAYPNYVRDYKFTFESKSIPQDWRWCGCG